MQEQSSRWLVRVLLPGAAALLLTGVLLPQRSAAQTDPTATPQPQATGIVTGTATATITAAAAPAVTATTAPTTTVAPTTTATVTATTGVTTADTRAAAAASPAATVRTSQGVRLRVRSGPGANYPIVARLTNGQTVTVFGRDATSQWLLVETAGPGSDFGWIAAAFARTNTPVAGLPVSHAISRAAPVNGAGVTTSMTGSMTGNVTAGAVVPPLSNLPGKIAVPVFDTDRQVYNVWLVDASGTNLRLVVENASSPALSTDGTRLAYRHWQRDDRGIVVAGRDGANPLRLTDKLEDVLPTFSPDQTKIVFSTYRQGDRLSRIYYVWTDEQNRRAWEWGAGGLFGEDPDWMADGQIVFHSRTRDGETDQIWIMNGDASNPRPFYSRSTRAGGIAALAGGPDSRTVAFMASDAGNWDIYRVGIDGAAPQRLTDDPGQDGLPAWSPDGQSLAFVSDRSGQWALWVMDADGENERMLALLPGPVDGRVQFEPDYLNHGWLEEQIAWSR